jgi:hypothetical protein
MVGLVAWAVVIAAFLVVEGVALVRPYDQWPAFSDVMRMVTSSALGRWALFALWLWLGWHLFVRGWQFFLRAPAEPAPPDSGPGRGAALAPVAIDDLLRHDIIPLLFVYVAVVAMLGHCARVLRTRSRNGRGAVSAGPQDSRGAGSAGPQDRLGPGSLQERTSRGWRPLLRHIAVTSACGYLMFLGVVGLLYGLVAEVTLELLRDAVVGGGFLAFVVAVPVFVALSWVTAGARAR